MGTLICQNNAKGLMFYTEESYFRTQLLLYVVAHWLWPLTPCSVIWPQALRGLSQLALGSHTHTHISTACCYSVHLTHTHCYPCTAVVNLFSTWETVLNLYPYVDPFTGEEGERQWHLSPEEGRVSGGISLSHTHKHTETQRREHRVKPNECMNCVHGSSEGEMGKDRKKKRGAYVLPCTHTCCNPPPYKHWPAVSVFSSRRRSSSIFPLQKQSIQHWTQKLQQYYLM